MEKKIIIFLALKFKNVEHFQFFKNKYVVDTQNTFHDDENPLHNLFLQEKFNLCQNLNFQIYEIAKNC